MENKDKTWERWRDKKNLNLVHALYSWHWIKDPNKHMKPWIDGQRENKARREMLYFLKRKSEAFTVELSRHGVKVVTGTFEGAALQSKRHVGGSDADVEMIMLLCGFLLLYETAEELAPPLQLFLCSPHFHLLSLRDQQALHNL